MSSSLDLYCGKRVLVTGGAGFIGSHLVDRLMMGGCEVKVIDNLSSGSLNNLKQWLNNRNFKFFRGDLRDPNKVEEALKEVELVFHFAANPEVRVSSIDPRVSYEQNVSTTYNLLEAMRRSEKAKTIVFASSSTVYGEAKTIPTPESYGPLNPISVYGASKLACEALILGYANTFNFKAVIYRLANIVGGRSNHGVIIDFIRKLKKNPKELEVLGDGNQTKSYLHVSDCINAILTGLLAGKEKIEVFNVGSKDWVNVKTIAEIVASELGLKDVKVKFTGGVNGGRGWIGDIKAMLLNVSKLFNLGWKPRYNSKEAVRLATKEELGLI